MQTLKDLLALNDRAIVYFCFKKRRRADLQFIKRAKKAFVVEEMPDQNRPAFERQQLFLFSLSSKTASHTGQSSGGGGGSGEQPLCESVEGPLPTASC